MPREKNRKLRTLVPLIIIGFAIATLLYLARQSSTQPNTPIAPDPQAAQSTPDTLDPTDTLAAAPESSPAASEDAEPTEAAPQESIVPVTPAFTGDLRARPVAGDSPPPTILGSLDPDSDNLIELTLTTLGAGIESLSFSQHYKTIQDKVHQGEHFQLQARQTYPAGSITYEVAPLAARIIEIIPLGGKPQYVDLFTSQEGRVWRETAPGEFEAVIVDESDTPILVVKKHYILSPGSYQFRVEQSILNLTSSPIDTRLFQYGPIDPPADVATYGGDRRRVRFGYLVSQQEDQTRQFVEPDSALRSRMKVLKQATKSGGDLLLWPGADTERELVWAALTGRYFAFAVFPALDDTQLANLDAGTPIDKRLRAVEKIHGIALGIDDRSTPFNDRILSLQLTSPTMRIEPGASASLNIAAYAGPMWGKAIDAEPALLSLGLDGLVVFNLGGMCAFCTFSWLSHGLHWFLSTVHSYITFDWALSIMLLVVIVRSILHPVTKKSQISLQRFSKQMQDIGPKQKKVNERFKDDPKRKQEEMMKLYREENIKFTGALGCLPMLLQSPIWIALYAMLFFTFDLRHNPAFFGIFQNITGGAWSFMADLSAPDSIITFGKTLRIPFIGAMVGDINSFNILPILMGAVFFIQQKYLTPPPSASMSPEQMQQQKIMKIMMVGMFPIIMYNAPSGLALYFVTNSTLAIIESRYIRAHIDKLDLEPPKPKKTKRKRVRNEAKSPFNKKHEREGAAYKPRRKN